jgi:hypothetical protein
VKRQHCLLRLSFYRESLGSGLLYRGPDRSRILRITFVAATEWFHPAGGHQLDFVTERRELPRPVLRPSASFHTDQTRGSVGEVFQESIAFELAAYDFSSVGLDPVQLKDALRDVNTNNGFAGNHRNLLVVFDEPLDLPPFMTRPSCFTKSMELD